MFLFFNTYGILFLDNGYFERFALVPYEKKKYLEMSFWKVVNTVNRLEDEGGVM